VPATSDDFEGPRVGPQWQWQANPQADWYSLSERPGSLRLRAQPPAAPRSLYLQPNLLLQKLPAPELAAETALRFSPATTGERAGLLVFGDGYAWIGVEKGAGGLRVRQVVANDARSGGGESETASAALHSEKVHLHVVVSSGARCRFSYSEDGQRFEPLGGAFQATGGRWMGSKLGVFAVAAPGAAETGHADFEWFEVTP